MSPTRNLQSITTDPAFYGRMAELALAVTEQADAAALTALLTEATRELGADHAAFASFMRDDEAYNSYRFVMACDATWCLEYEEQARYLDDPWLRYVRHHADAALTDSIEARTAPEREVVELAHSFGFASAVVVPSQPPEGLTHLGALCFGSECKGYFSPALLGRVAVATQPLAQRMHAWQVAQLRAELLERVRLSEDELSLLRYERERMSSKEIARLTGVSALSVDSRWQRLNAKLGVSSRGLAARVAAEYGLI